MRSKRMNKAKITAVGALGNFMIKQHGAPVYEFLMKFGKAHKPWFRFSCQAMGDTVIGTGRSKSDAKQIVARMMLEKLSLRGYRVPAEFASSHAMDSLMDQADLPTYSFVVLLRELCKKYRLDPVEYQVFADHTGLPSHFTVKARIGCVERFATDSSKRIAHNLAAEQIYRHLRTYLHTPNFEEERVLHQAYERAMAPSDEDTTDDQLNNQEELQDEAAAAPNRTRKKNRRSSAAKSAAQSAAQSPVQAAINLELEEQAEGSYEDGPARLPRAPSPFAARPLDQIIAMQFITRTLERLGL